MQRRHHKIPHFAWTPLTQGFARSAFAGAGKLGPHGCKPRGCSRWFCEFASGSERGSIMKCATVRLNLAGYLDDALVSAASEVERVQIRQHLDACSACREELQS